MTPESTNTPSSGMSLSDKIAMGLGVPVGLTTVIGVYCTVKMYRPMHKQKQTLDIESNYSMDRLPRRRRGERDSRYGRVDSGLGTRPYGHETRGYR